MIARVIWIPHQCVLGHSDKLNALITLAWKNFVEERTEYCFTLFWTDIDVIRPENVMEFVLMEKTEG